MKLERSLLIIGTATVSVPVAPTAGQRSYKRLMNSFPCQVMSTHLNSIRRSQVYRRDEKEGRRPSSRNLPALDPKTNPRALELARKGKNQLSIVKRGKLRESLHCFNVDLLNVSCSTVRLSSGNCVET